MDKEVFGTGRVRSKNVTTQNLHVRERATFGWGEYEITFSDLLKTIHSLQVENKELRQRLSELEPIVEKLKDTVDALWHAPPGGGPGYAEVLNQWNERNEEK